MVYVHGYPPPPVAWAEPPPPPDRPWWRHAAWCFLTTWWFVAAGSGVCTALAFNVLSLVLFPLAMPVGFILGATYGLPVVVAIAIWLGFQRPGPDPTRFVRTLKIVGAGIAVLINGFTNVIFAANFAQSNRSYRPVPLWLIVGVGALAVAFIAASGFVGWMFGATLAQRHLERIGHPAAAARRAARARRWWR